MSVEIKEATKNLGQAPLTKLLLKLSLPAMASMATMAFYNLINTFWVSRLGYEPIAVITIMMPYFMFSVAIASGIGIGVNALVSRRFGEKNIEAADRACGQIFPLSAFFGLIFIVAAVGFPSQILTLCGARPELIDLATPYLKITGLGVPFVMFVMTGTNLLRGSGEAIRPMIFTLISSIVNMILDPLLIFGIGPFPEIGFPGAALATALSQFTSASVIFFYILSGKSAYHFKIKNTVPDFGIIRDIFRVGLPSAIVEFMESVIFIFYNHVLAGFGSIALAAGGLMMRAIDFAFMPIFGAMQGLLPIVGYCFGARMWQRLWRAVKTASSGMAILLLLATICLEIWGGSIIRIFTSDPELLQIATLALRIIVSSLAFAGPTMLFITTFQGLSKGRTALFLSLIRQVALFIPLVILLPKYLGLNGVWITLPLTDVLAFLVVTFWLLREYQLSKKESAYHPN